MHPIPHLCAQDMNFASGKQLPVKWDSPNMRIVKNGFSVTTVRFGIWWDMRIPNPGFMRRGGSVRTAADVTTALGRTTALPQIAGAVPMSRYRDFACGCFWDTSIALRGLRIHGRLRSGVRPVHGVEDRMRCCGSSGASSILRALFLLRLCRSWRHVFLRATSWRKGLAASYLACDAAVRGRGILLRCTQRGTLLSWGLPRNERWTSLRNTTRLEASSTG